MIYLDNAATTLRKPPQVGEAMLNALQTLGNSARGAHAGAMDAAHTIYNTRVKLAKLFHCPRADHVIFTCNVTEALNTALDGLLREGDHAVSTVMEHNSVLRPLYRLMQERGVQVDFAPANEHGRIDLDALAQLCHSGTRLVVCAHASNLTGNLIDIRRVSEIAHAQGALLVVDAAQTAGAREIDMEELGIDVLCFTGHKALMGPQGTGGLCIRPGIEIAPLKVGGTGVQTYLRTQPKQYPTRLEAGTLNGHGIAGLSAALDFINEVGLSAIEEREAALTQQLYNGMRSIPGVTIYGDFSTAHAGIITLNIRDLDSSAVADALAEEYGIATRAGAHCAPRAHEALGTVEQGAVRFSVSYFTTEDEIDTAIRAVRDLAEEKQS